MNPIKSYLTPTTFPYLKAGAGSVLAIIMGLLVLALLAAGCGKSGPRTAEERALDRHEKEVRQRKDWKEQRETQRKELMKQPWTNWSSGPSTMEAAKFLSELLKSGQLPDTEDARHHLDFTINPFATNYPQTHNFTLKMNTEPFVNHYTTVKKSADSSWVLAKAWRTDAQGKTVKVYQVP